MIVIENKLNKLNIEELSIFYNFYHMAELVLNKKYSDAKVLLENCNLDLDNVLFLKAFVYEKTQILASHKICFDMLNKEFQGIYKLIISKNYNSPEIKERIKELMDTYKFDKSELLFCKKIAWKEMLLKAGEDLKQALCDYISENEHQYPECESFR